MTFNFLMTLMTALAAAICSQFALPPRAQNAFVNAPGKINSSTFSVQTTLSECSRKRAVGLPSGVNIPQELCFDDKKAVDASEKSKAKTGNSPQSSLIAGTKISFGDLPKEVQNIVRLTAPEMDISAVVFDLTIIPTPDAKAGNNLVKSYSYGSASKNKSPGRDPNHHSWLFKRQNNFLKLESAEIDTTK